MDSIYIIFLDMINRIVRIFFACGEGPFGRRPHYPNDPVDPVQFFYGFLWQPPQVVGPFLGLPCLIIRRWQPVQLP